MKRILFYFGHPAQFLFARQSIINLKNNGHHVRILIKSKDVLEKLIKNAQFEYHNILSEGRKDSKAGILWGLIKRDIRLFLFLRNNKTDIMVGTDPSLSHIGKLLRIPVITTLEDDYDVIPQLVKTTYPFTKHILVPNVCNVGKKYEHKKLTYNGYMKLGYLHPRYFQPDKTKAPNTDKPYIMVRLAKLTAYHDGQIKGLNTTFVNNLLGIIQNDYTLYLNSEYPLPKQFEQYRMQTKPEDIHHALYYSTIFISDSQSMTMEAAMLGVPSIRYSDFAGRISVLDELEQKYKLTSSIKPPNETKLFDTVLKLLATNNLRAIYQSRRENMLLDKIDVTKFLTWFIESYPKSVEIMNKNPEKQLSFK